MRRTFTQYRIPSAEEAVNKIMTGLNEKAFEHGMYFDKEKKKWVTLVKGGNTKGDK